MARSTLLLTLAALALLCTATAMRFDYTVRIMNRKTGSWVSSLTPNFRIPDKIPIVVDEKSNGRYSEWKVTDTATPGVHYIFNVGTDYAVTRDEAYVLATTGDHDYASLFRIESVGVSAYRILELDNGMCWTLLYDSIKVEECDERNDAQVWEFRPTAFFDDLAFWF